MTVYIQLFLEFLKMGLFCIGGGYANLTMIEQQATIKNGWITKEEFTDIVTISQMTPGPIGINSATFIGNRVAGFGGSVVSVVAFLIPSLIIIVTLSYLYSKYNELHIVKGVFTYLQPVVAALIGISSISMISKTLFDMDVYEFSIDNLDYVAVFLLMISFILIYKFKMNPIIIMLICGLVGMIVYPTQV